MAEYSFVVLHKDIPSPMSTEGWTSRFYAEHGFDLRDDGVVLMIRHGGSVLHLPLASMWYGEPKKDEEITHAAQTGTEQKDARPAHLDRNHGRQIAQTSDRNRLRGTAAL